MYKKKKLFFTIINKQKAFYEYFVHSQNSQKKEINISGSVVKIIKFVHNNLNVIFVLRLCLQSYNL